MPKHNKKRNTVFLYEILVREAVKQSLNKNIEKRNKIISTLKKVFGVKTILGQELRLFKNLLETREISTRAAERLIQETKKEYLKFNPKEIFEAQSALIKKINKEISKSVFSNFVPNYKDLATLSQIFNTDINIKKRVLLEEGILNKIIQKTDTTIQDKKSKISNLVVNGFVKKFNSKYGPSLLENQKALLSRFILSFMDEGTDFKIFLNEEIENLKRIVRSSFKLEELKKDDVMMNKMKEVLKLLDESSKKPIDNDFLRQLLKIQAVAQEVKD